MNGLPVEFRKLTGGLDLFFIYSRDSDKTNKTPESLIINICDQQLMMSLLTFYCDFYRKGPVDNSNSAIINTIAVRKYNCEQSLSVASEKTK